MIKIELNKIKKNFGLKNILDGFNLELRTGERVALIGQNGSGKSTILKIIAKQESIDSGTINIRSGAKIGILNQIYENEKEDISVEDFLYKSFEEILKSRRVCLSLKRRLLIIVFGDIDRRGLFVVFFRFIYVKTECLHKGNKNQHIQDGRTENSFNSLFF